MKRGKFWKYFLAFCALSLLSLPAFSEPETEFEIPELEPTEEYVMTGEDIMTLYQTINDLNETKEKWKNLTDETMKTLEDARTLLGELENENEKLVLGNNFLIGTTVCSIGICVAGVIVWACTK